MIKIYEVYSRGIHLDCDEYRTDSLWLNKIEAEKRRKELDEELPKGEYDPRFAFVSERKVEDSENMVAVKTIKSSNEKEDYHLTDKDKEMIRNKIKELNEKRGN